MRSLFKFVASGLVGFGLAALLMQGKPSQQPAQPPLSPETLEALLANKEEAARDLPDSPEKMLALSAGLRAKLNGFVEMTDGKFEYEIVTGNEKTKDTIFFKTNLESPVKEGDTIEIFFGAPQKDKNGTYREPAVKLTYLNFNNLNNYRESEFSNYMETAIRGEEAVIQRLAKELLTRGMMTPEQVANLTGPDVPAPKSAVSTGAIHGKQ